MLWIPCTIQILLPLFTNESWLCSIHYWLQCVPGFQIIRLDRDRYDGRIIINFTYVSDKYASLQHIPLDSVSAGLFKACMCDCHSFPQFFVACMEPIRCVFVGGYNIENHVLFSLRLFPVRTPPYYTEVVSCSPVPKFQSQQDWAPPDTKFAGQETNNCKRSIWSYAQALISSNQVALKTCNKYCKVQNLMKCTILGKFGHGIKVTYYVSSMTK